MSELFSQSLRDVLKVSASSEPAPGGGSVSAITAAFAASMAAMVGNLTVGKKRYKAVEPQVMAIRDRAVCLLSRFEELVDEDMAQFRRFIGHYKMPATTPEEQATKDSLIQESLKGATETPLEIARTCLSVLEMVAEIAPIGSQMAISDAGVAAYLAEASLKAALLNVDINLPQIKDAKFADDARREKDGLISQAEKILRESMAVVSSRLGS